VAKCIYCGQWTGLFGHEHAECRVRHDRAVSLIPGFFGKLMDSPTPPEKFVELLQQAGDASFIDRNQLRDLSKASMDTVIDWIVAERCATIAEARRLVDIADALEKAFPEGLDLNETVTKVIMLAELSAGIIPNYVSISGQVPIDFGPRESGLWIFNQVDAWWTGPTEEAGAIRLGPAEGATNVYVARNPADLPPIRAPEGKPRRGDLLITNRKMYFIRNESKHVAVPVAQILSLTPYADGISLIYNPRKPRAALFHVNDPWFAANLVAGLVLQMPSVVG
jgi:hypothetical protein